MFSTYHQIVTVGGIPKLLPSTSFLGQKPFIYLSQIFQKWIIYNTTASAGNLGVSCSYFEENCPPNSSYVRLNRYPPCPYSSNLQMFGLVPHTDSDFLSVVSQDDVGGLQLFKDERWVAVKPNPRALVINIGDLFQALSNGVYKSIRHRVVASSGRSERFSAAYFYCPNNDARIESCSDRQSSLYRDFTFREYKSQIQKDVQDTGDKVGLPRFLTIINNIYIS